ncbi:hypothetical protein [uncultured Flavobacterium sp.]|uniref:hypothetical protein n=1 Tax=uncultured Flavobacterium sp. TaxID=165435 RepID=UPI0030CA37B7
MKEKILGFSLLSMIIINFWTLYGFFDYFTEKESTFHGLNLLIFYIFSLYFSIGLGIILLIIRIINFLKYKQNNLKVNFFYIFSFIFNINLFIIWIIAMFLKILSFNQHIVLLAIGGLLISIIIIFDIYKSNNKLKIFKP